MQTVKGYNRMRIIFLITILVLIIIGCEDQKTLPLSSTQYEQWRSYNIHNYTIDQIRYCFCINGGEKMKITVRADSVYQVMRLSDSTIISNPNSKQYLTIDSLFGIIKNSKTDSLVVTYDSKYGFPDKLDINPQQHPYDGGVLYLTSNLQASK
jgi:hypothetical protein